MPTAVAAVRPRPPPIVLPSRPPTTAPPIVPAMQLNSELRDCPCEPEGAWQAVSAPMPTRAMAAAIPLPRLFLFIIVHPWNHCFVLENCTADIHVQENAAPGLRGSDPMWGLTPRQHTDYSRAKALQVHSAAGRRRAFSCCACCSN